MIISSPFYKWGNGGMESTSGLLLVPRLVRIRLGFEPRESDSTVGLLPCLAVYRQGRDTKQQEMASAWGSQGRLQGGGVAQAERPESQESLGR